MGSNEKRLAFTNLFFYTSTVLNTHMAIAIYIVFVRDQLF